MTFKVNRKSLADQMGLLSVATEKKTTMPILSNVKMECDGTCLTITATDIDMTVITELEASGEAWSGCVPSRELRDLAGLFNGEEIELAPLHNERIEVKWGKSRHRLPVSPVSDFPPTERAQVLMVTVDGERLRAAIIRALRCISTDAKESWMHGVSLCSRDGFLIVTGTNSRQLATTAIPSTLDIDLILPQRAANALVKFLEGETEIGATENQVIFRQGSKVFLARLSGMTYPDWRPLVPASFKHSFVLDSKAASKAFRLAAVTAENFAMVPIPLSLALSQKEMTIESRESKVGHSVETLPIDCPTLNGSSLAIGINGAHFISYLDLESDPVIAFNDDLKMFHLSTSADPNYRYITMTLRA